MVAGYVLKVDQVGTDYLLVLLLVLVSDAVREAEVVDTKAEVIEVFEEPVDGFNVVTEVLTLWES